MNKLNTTRCSHTETLVKDNLDEGGFTLIEILVSISIMLLFLPFAASMLTNSQLLASYSKHKMEAAYAAQQLIETQRQQPFLTIAPGNSVLIPSASPFWQYVALDTKGNYSNVTYPNPSIFWGKASITVTPTVYTPLSGQPVTSSNVDHYVVTINWVEQIFNIQVTMNETYAEDFANDTMLD